MAKDREASSAERIETSIIPLKYVDMIEDVFHAILAFALLIIGIVAFYYTVEKLLTTDPLDRKSVV